MDTNYGASLINSFNPDPTGMPTSTVTGSAGNMPMGGTVRVNEDTTYPNITGRPNSYTTDGSVQVMSDLPSGGLMLDSTIHKNLDPRLWDSNEHLIPVVHDKLLEIANFFRDTVDFYIVKDIKITGSEANYNYTENSDIDLHLVYDFQSMNIDPKLLRTYFKAKKDLFNKEYDLTIKGIPVEVGVEDINTPLVATGSYSLLNDEWIVKPTNSQKEIPEIYDADVQNWKNKITRAINTNDRDVIAYTWNELKQLRKDSLYAATGGEFAVGNLVYKRLRAEGDIKRLANALISTISKQLSLENVETTLSSDGEVRSFL